MKLNIIIICSLLLNPAMVRAQGIKSPSDFAKLGTEAIDSTKHYISLVKQFNCNKLPPSKLINLAKKAFDRGDKNLAYKIANHYIAGLKKEEMFTKENLWFIYDFTITTKDRGFVYFRDNAEKLARLDNKMTKEISAGKVQSLIYNTEMKPYASSSSNSIDWKNIETRLRKYGIDGKITYDTYKKGMQFDSEVLPKLKKGYTWGSILPVIKGLNAGKGEEFLFGSTVIYYIDAIFHGEKNLSNFIGSGKYYGEHFSADLKAEARNIWGWLLFEKSSDYKEIRTAIEWVKPCIENGSKDTQIIDTYANLLYKIGRKEEAIEWEEKAVQIEEENALKSNRKPDPVFAETLNKMKAGVKTWKE